MPVSLIVRHLHVPVNPLVVFLPIQLLFRLGPPPELASRQTLFTPPPDPLARYRSALIASIASLFFPGIAALTLAGAFQIPVRGYLVLVVLALPVIVYRAHRRYRELSFLPTPTKA